MKLDLPELFADPFGERAEIIARPPQRLLGARVIFESDTSALLRIVDSAYAGLPEPRLPAGAPTLRVRLLLAPAPVGRSRSAPSLLTAFSASGILGGATGSSNLVMVAPQARSALVVVSPQMLRFPYHLRYELLEFAVYTLAARVNELVSLHAACVASGGRAALLMGESGAGKSTIALQCLRQNLQLVAEDSTLVAPGTMRAMGVANFLHVRSDSLRWIPTREARRIRSSPVITRRSGARKFEVDLRGAGSPPAAAVPRLKAVVFLSARRAAGGTRLLPLPRAALLARLEAMQPFAAGQPHWSAFCRQAARLGAFELRRGAHPLEAVDCVRDLLSRRC
jgi:hypothetical protein